MSWQASSVRDTKVLLILQWRLSRIGFLKNGASAFAGLVGILGAPFSFIGKFMIFPGSLPPRPQHLLVLLVNLHSKVCTIRNRLCSSGTATSATKLPSYPVVPGGSDIKPCSILAGYPKRLKMGRRTDTQANEEPWAQRDKAMRAARLPGVGTAAPSQRIRKHV